MKNLLILTILLSFSACEKHQIEKIEERDLVGEWGTESIQLIDINGNEIDHETMAGSYLRLSDDKTFILNYVGGTWSVDDRKLMVKNQLTDLSFSFNYRIMDVNDESLVLKIEDVNSENAHHPLKGIDDNLQSIVETFKKIE
ncbi:hypothetical protein [Portibacter marinus]|uniref:hypothetical protein n=1 Tax=Portibacter marinus TaxID=2898660 RepID=UPI001F44E13C|nr:hypothetical protein [Portibacter marinus]